MRSVDVGHKVNLHVPPVGLQCLGHHQGTLESNYAHSNIANRMAYQIGTANAYIDDVRDGFTGVTSPSTASNILRFTFIFFI